MTDETQEAPGETGSDNEWPLQPIAGHSSQADDAHDENVPELTARDKEKIVEFMRSDVDVATDPIELFRTWAWENVESTTPDELRPISDQLLDDRWPDNDVSLTAWWWAEGRAEYGRWENRVACGKLCDALSDPDSPLSKLMGEVGDAHAPEQREPVQGTCSISKESAQAAFLAAAGASTSAGHADDEARATQEPDPFEHWADPQFQRALSALVDYSPGTVTASGYIVEHKGAQFALKPDDDDDSVVVHATEQGANGEVMELLACGDRCGTGILEIRPVTLTVAATTQGLTADESRRLVGRMFDPRIPSRQPRRVAMQLWVAVPIAVIVAIAVIAAVSWGSAWHYYGVSEQSERERAIAQEYMDTQQMNDALQAQEIVALTTERKYQAALIAVEALSSGRHDPLFSETRVDVVKAIIAEVYGDQDMAAIDRELRNLEKTKE